MIVGVTSDLIGPAELDRFRAVVKVDGAVVSERLTSVRDAVPPSFPLEIPVSDVHDGGEMEILLEAYKGIGDVKPIVTRTARTTAVAGRTLLLRARIEKECVPGYRLEADKNTPECPAPETCVAASCHDPYVPPHMLEDYTPEWTAEFADACRPLQPGDPEVILGAGVDGYMPLEDGDPVELVMGPQGWFHFWVTVRMKNLHQTGSITTLTGEWDGPAEDVPTLQMPFGYEPSGGGWCDLTGLRYELLFSHADAPKHYGRELRLDAQVVDVTGALGFATRRVVLAPPP